MGVGDAVRQNSYSDLEKYNVNVSYNFFSILKLLHTICIFDESIHNLLFKATILT